MKKPIYFLLSLSLFFALNSLHATEESGPHIIVVGHRIGPWEILPIGSQLPVTRLDSRGGDEIGPNASGDIKKLACNARVDNLVKQCISLYNNLGTGSLGFCATVGSLIPSFGAAFGTMCADVVGRNFSTAHDWCVAQGKAKKERECTP